VDDRIYNEFRQFRYPGAVKFNDWERGVYPYSRATGNELCDGNDIPFDVWKDHVVCSVPDDFPEFHILSETESMRALMKVKPTSIHSVEQRAMDDHYGIAAPTATPVSAAELATRTANTPTSRPATPQTRKRTSSAMEFSDSQEKRTECLPGIDDELSNSLSAFRNSISN
jgi:hypothetical protein